VLSAPSKQLETLPGTLMLTDCLEACQANESCSAVNYETGLCVMFRSTADQLPGESTFGCAGRKEMKWAWRRIGSYSQSVQFPLQSLLKRHKILMTAAKQTS